MVAQRNGMDSDDLARNGVLRSAWLARRFLRAGRAWLAAARIGHSGCARRRAMEASPDEDHLASRVSRLGISYRIEVRFFALALVWFLQERRLGVLW